MYPGLASLAASPQYRFVPGAVRSFYQGLADYDLSDHTIFQFRTAATGMQRFNTFGCYHNILLTKHLIVVEVREAFIKKKL